MPTEILNTCYIESGLKSIVNYSHIIPIVLSLGIVIFVFSRAKNKNFSKIFILFILMFCFWLIGDLITWNSINYNLIYMNWAFLPFLEVVLYILGLYFALISIKKSDVSNIIKTILFILTLPILFMTIMGYSVTGFNHSVCEATNNNVLDIYKLSIEAILLLTLLFYIIRMLISKNKNKGNLIVLGSMFLFLSIFGVTEYIGATTGFYELNLYSLFLFPVFLLIIIYAIFELDIFNFEVLGTQYLVVGLVILMIGQLFFVNGNTDRLLTVITVIITVSLSIILFRNLKKETDQRIKIEDLSIQLDNYNKRLRTSNEKLKGLDKMKTEFVSLASHQLRSPLTAIKGYTSMLLQGDYGDLNLDAKQTIERVMESSNNLTLVVEDLLNVSKIEQGGMKYEMARFDFGELVESTAKELSVTAQNKGLVLNDKISPTHKYFVNGDKEKLRQILVNLIDNSMKYTKRGHIDVGLQLKDGKIILSIKDTGVGIPAEIKETLFEKFARGEGAKLNASGSGLGLYLAKEIIDAHKGRIWAESEGTSKGSTFFVEIDEAKKE